MALRTPLSAARGLGSAKSGFGHWWMARVTSIALIPLTLWFVFTVASFGSMDHTAFVAWVRSPMITVLLIITLAVTIYHTMLGLRVIIEDYVHVEWMKVTGVMIMNFTCVLLLAVGLLATLKIFTSA
ncbi:MAG: succinate dehydrogenase, hydrophobic membrane anchor protein [Pseudomonadota bacterium]|nr:succinate dehydrogenase, hydrophobic membrane anchor protein [Pseudomonadota bacterium]